MLKMNSKVEILKFTKINNGGHFVGRVIGVEMAQSKCYVGFTTEKAFLDTFDTYKYKVAYIAGNSMKVEWFWAVEVAKITKARVV